MRESLRGWSLTPSPKSPVRGEPVKIRSMVAEGNVAQVLLEASDGTELLVVGSRGRGGFAGALLGSVSQHCVQQATCPVAVIRDPA